LAKLPRLPTVEVPRVSIITQILDDSKKAQREVTDGEDAGLSLDVPCVQDGPYSCTFPVQSATNQELHPSRRCRGLAASGLSTCEPGASPQITRSQIMAEPLAIAGENAWRTSIKSFFVIYLGSWKPISQLATSAAVA
jgi:hypothetical protein